MQKREGAREEEKEGVSEGLSRFSVKILMAHSTEELRSGTLLCFTKFLVSKNVRDKRGREYHVLPSNCCVSQYRINS